MAEPGEPCTRLEPRPRGGAIVEQAYARPDWATGAVSSMDAWFLADCLAEFKPSTIIEIGVASGVSTAFLLRAIELLGLDARLYSFDILKTYYADPARKLGAFVDESFPATPPRLSLFPGVRSMNVPDRLSALGIVPAEFVFIDADHQHPWPCLDLIAVLRAVAPGTWVVLHDIGLPILHPELSSSGPAFLFERWPGPKRIFDIGEATQNIGAIRLFDAIEQNVDAVLSVLELAWETPVNATYFRAVTALLDQLGGGRGEVLRTMYRRNVPASTPARQFLDRAKSSLQRRLAARHRRLA